MSTVRFPGLVDVHVHLREPGAMQKEDFYTGTQAAIAGGYTQVLDMPNNTPATISPQNLEEKIKLAKGRIWCDLGFNFGGTPQSSKFFKNIKSKVFGLKVYMNQTTGTLLVESDKERDLLFKKWESNLPIMVHAEGETVETAIKLAKKNNRRVHICHITGDQIDSIVKAKKLGLAITCEVCPHHLFLSSKNLKKLGTRGMMKPPLENEKNMQKLWNNIENIDMISTDHAPHTLDEKKDIKSPKFGVPGLETTLSLMLGAVERKKITQQRLVEMLSTNPRRIFNLPQQKNTYIEIDTSKKVIFRGKKFFTKCKWTPFEGIEGRGKILKVVLRGKTIFENGDFKNRPAGIVIYPN